MAKRKADGRTQRALLARGLDSELANRLVEQGYTVASLATLAPAGRVTLGLSEVQAATLNERTPIPEETLVNVLAASRWTRCVCRDDSRGIVVHHIDSWASSRSHDEDNLVVLCLSHHDEAHTRRKLTIQLTPSRIKQLRNKWYAEALANTKEVLERSAQDAQSDNLAPDDRYTAWFQLLGLLVSPKTSAEVAADAAYRISWYLPAVDDCRSAAARAALQKLTDDQILALLSAAGNLFAQLDGSPAEHVAGLLSYDEQAGERIVVGHRDPRKSGQVRCGMKKWPWVASGDRNGRRGKITRKATVLGGTKASLDHGNGGQG